MNRTARSCQSASLIQRRDNHSFLTVCGMWTLDPKTALPFDTHLQALTFCHEVGLGDVEIVPWSDKVKFRPGLAFLD